MFPPFPLLLPPFLPFFYNGCCCVQPAVLHILIIKLPALPTFQSLSALVMCMLSFLGYLIDVFFESEAQSGIRAVFQAMHMFYRAETFIPWHFDSKSFTGCKVKRRSPSNFATSIGGDRSIRLAVLLATLWQYQIDGGTLCPGSLVDSSRTFGNAKGLGSNPSCGLVFQGKVSRPPKNIISQPRFKRGKVLWCSILIWANGGPFAPGSAVGSPVT